jgi:hypothetical protein
MISEDHTLRFAKGGCDMSTFFGFEGNASERGVEPVVIIEAKGSSQWRTIRGSQHLRPELVHVLLCFCAIGTHRQASWLIGSSMQPRLEKALLGTL